MKYLPYINITLKSNFFSLLKILFINNMNEIEIESQHKKNYCSYFNYYEKCWITYEQNFNNLNEEKESILNRTNNTCESYHSHLNSIVGLKEPRISYLVQVLF